MNSSASRLGLTTDILLREVPFPPPDTVGVRATSFVAVLALPVFSPGIISGVSISLPSSAISICVILSYLTSNSKHIDTKVTE
uniref:Putative ovule protein n=1 Tax=Solanum chacoense TaxID=4108 RepID=A0A0V0GY68_SOLCH